MLFFGIFIKCFHRTTRENPSEKFCLKKEDYDAYYDEQIIRKCRFYYCLFGNFSHASDPLGSYPGLEICCSLQVYVEVDPSDSQLVGKAVKALY